MKTNHRWRGLAHVLITAAVAVLAALSVYLFAVRPWQLRWGASDAEVGQALPGDAPA